MNYVKNTPEYIKKLASKILAGENIVFQGGRKTGRITVDFTINLFEELHKQAKENNRRESYFYHEEGIINEDSYKNI